MPIRPVSAFKKRKADRRHSIWTRDSRISSSLSRRPKKPKTQKEDDKIAGTCHQLDNGKDDDEDWLGQALPPRRASQYEPMEIPVFDDEKDSDYLPGSQESMQPPGSAGRMCGRRVDSSPTQASAQPKCSPTMSGTPPALEVPSSSPIDKDMTEEKEASRPESHGLTTPARSAPQVYRNQFSPTQESANRHSMRLFMCDEEMEQWEVAPGVVRAPVHGQQERWCATPGIAFSTPFLRHNTVPIFPGLTCDVITVTPGQSYSWDPVPAKRRIATILEGKLQINSRGEEFQLGPGGMFKIQEAQSGKCATTTVAKNGWYIGAVLQLLTIDLDTCSCDR